MVHGPWPANGKYAAQETLSRAAESKRSVRVWEYVGKARMLELCLPALPSTLLDDKSLYTLHLMTPAEILAALGTKKLSPREFDTMMELLAILAVAIDSAVLKKITLGRPVQGTAADLRQQ